DVNLKKVILHFFVHYSLENKRRTIRMKMRFIFLALLSILTLSIISQKISYAYELPLVKIERVSGKAPYLLEESADRVFIKLSSDNQTLSVQSYDSQFIYGLAKIETLYDT